MTEEKLIVRSGEKESAVTITAEGDRKSVLIEGKPCEVDFRLLTPNTISLIINGRSHLFHIEKNETGYRVEWSRGKVHFEVEDARSLLQKQLLRSKSSTIEKITLKAPMPGLIVKVLTTVGAKIAKGSPLLVVEAMKMENEITAPASGKVWEIKVCEKQAVEKNEPLLVIVGD